MVDNSVVERDLVLGAQAGTGDIGQATDPGIHLRLPAGDVDSPEVTILVPAVNEELTISEFVTWCHEGLRERWRGRRDTRSSTARQTARPSLPWLAGRGCSLPPSGASAAPTSMPCHTSAADTWSWATPTARMTFASSRRSSRRCAAAPSMRWGRAGRARSSRARCPPCTGTSARRSRPGSSTALYGSRFSDIHCGMRGITRRRALPDGSGRTVLGVRLGDGAEVGPDGPAHHRGAGHLLP